MAGSQPRNPSNSIKAQKETRQKSPTPSQTQSRVDPSSSKAAQPEPENNNAYNAELQGVKALLAEVRRVEDGLEQDMLDNAVL